MDSEAIEAEKNVLDRARSGDPLAWEQLIRGYTHRIYNLCYRFVGRMDQAEELTQEVFLRAFRSLGSQNTEASNFATWVVSLTRNLLIDHYRKSHEERIPLSMNGPGKGEEGILDAFSRGQVSLEMMSENPERACLLNYALQGLSPELREAVILRDLEEFDYQEIGAILNIPEGTVKARINRARVEIAKDLRRRRHHSENASV